MAYDALTGAVLWESPVGTGIVAAPVSYEIAGIQYVSIAVGIGNCIFATECRVSTGHNANV